MPRRGSFEDLEGPGDKGLDFRFGDESFLFLSFFFFFFFSFLAFFAFLGLDEDLFSDAESEGEESDCDPAAASSSLVPIEEKSSFRMSSELFTDIFSVVSSPILN